MWRLIPFLFLAVSADAGFKKAVAGGEQFFLLLRDDGAVLGFGDCFYGNLGVADCRTLTKPTTIPLPAPAVDIAAAKWTSYAVLADGSVVSWGSDEEGMLGRQQSGVKRPSREGSPAAGKVAGIEKAAQIVATGDTVAVVTENGELWMWGTLFNARGPSTRSDVPKRIGGLPPLASFSMNCRDYAGVNHMFAVGRDGSLWTWGYNSLGQLGDGTTQSSPAPRKVDIPPVVSAAAGGNNGVAVLADGTVRVWGGNDSSTMGNGQNVQFSENPTPVPLAGVTGAASVSAGYGHIIVLLKNGTMRTWGHDGWGQAGIGTAGGYQMRPGAPKLTGVTAVFASRNRCFALTTGGRLWFWGPGYYRLPGVMKVNQKIPVDITALW
jgi:alpha-tubulin suppressor-like RCC1 family protein